MVKIELSGRAIPVPRKSGFITDAIKKPIKEATVPMTPAINTAKYLPPRIDNLLALVVRSLSS